LRSKAR